MSDRYSEDDSSDDINQSKNDRRTLMLVMKVTKLGVIFGRRYYIYYY